MLMPSVALQILFFFAAGSCVLGILFFVSRSEGGESLTPAAPKQGAGSSPAHAQLAGLRGALDTSFAFSKKSSQFVRNAFKQPHDIFVHTQEMLGRVRGEVQPSILDKTFDQDPEKRFSLQDMGSQAQAETAVPPTGVKQAPHIFPDYPAKAGRVGAASRGSITGQAPKLAQKLQDQFEERGEGNDAKADNEEEFWLGILRQNPHVAHPYKKLGEIYLKRGDYKEAHASLSFALTKDPNDQEAAALLAEAKEKRAAK